MVCKGMAGMSKWKNNNYYNYKLVFEKVPKKLIM